ncbi:hypothetical protein VNO77_34290 [Canavalia gladiata]|uniref:Uncharacterized protein n=1 Tax=Canavalia gladiata TaxID=3824 RepID=A0AAN9KFA7_CANGL
MAHLIKSRNQRPGPIRIRNQQSVFDSSPMGPAPFQYYGLEFLHLLQRLCLRSSSLKHIEMTTRPSSDSIGKQAEDMGFIKSYPIVY